MQHAGEVRLGGVAAKLRVAVEEGRAYDALQLYRTLTARHVTMKKFDEASKLLEDGAVHMLQHKEEQCGAELGLLLLETLQKAGASADRVYEMGAKLNGLFGAGAAPGKVSFLKAVAKHLEGARDGRAATVYGWLAVALSMAGDESGAEKHFLRSDAPEAFAKAVLAWSKEGLPEERDLFVARAVLRILCTRNLRLANAFLNAVFSTAQPPLASPLINYLRFLLLTLERDAHPLFVMLRNKYKASLARDPGFGPLLDQIAMAFYPRAAPAAGGGFADLMRAMLTGPAAAHSTK